MKWNQLLKTVDCDKLSSHKCFITFKDCVVLFLFVVRQRERAAVWCPFKSDSRSPNLKSLLNLLALLLPLFSDSHLQIAIWSTSSLRLIFQLFFFCHSFIIFLSRKELHDQAFSFHRCVILFHHTKRSSETERWKETKRENGKTQSERAGQISLLRVWMWEFCVCKKKAVWSRRVYLDHRSYISVMVSGRLVGISVRPFPLQSTMLLLQVHDSGHCNTLQEEDDDDWWPTQRQRANIIHG